MIHDLKHVLYQSCMHSALYLEGRGWLKKIGWGNGVYGNAWVFPIPYTYSLYNLWLLQVKMAETRELTEIECMSL